MKRIIGRHRYRLFKGNVLAVLLAAGAAAGQVSPSTVTAGQAPGPACGNCGGGMGCGGMNCHATQMQALRSGKHSGIPCGTCHEGAAAHAAAPSDPVLLPRVHFDQELCMGCHKDQYDSFEYRTYGRTFYGGSADPAHAWSKTIDLPNWNVLIDGHPFVLETYEDRPMPVNQIDHQETIRPGSESCLSCHGTKVAFYMGEKYKDASGNVVTIPARLGRIKAGRYVQDGQTGHRIYDGTSYRNPATGVWSQAVTTTFVPNGTTIQIMTDGTDPLFPYQVKTLVTLPTAVTQDVKDVAGAVVGRVTFRTIASYPEAGADINGVTGFSPPAAANTNVATVARDWIYATGEALAFDGLDYYFNLIDPGQPTHFTGGGYNWPSIQSGELCNQCHDPMAAKLRILKRALIEGIARNGVNPYDPVKRTIRRFEAASRQDQIIAVCAQCHSEYVGGYSAVDRRDREFFPWAKPTDLLNANGQVVVSGVDTLYRTLFGYNQDWTHGGPVRPWQTTNPNERGYYSGALYPIGEKLIKSQHPEAEVFWNSPMYKAGATCTDCHTMKLVSPATHRQYTSHWFTSPLNWMNLNRNSPFGKAMNPCQGCHQKQTIAQKMAEIKSIQGDTFTRQQAAQAELVNSLKAINAAKAARPTDPNLARAVWLHQNAHLRWEYYVQAENSMGFHNLQEAQSELQNALTWALEAQRLVKR